MKITNKNFKFIGLGVLVGMALGAIPVAAQIEISWPNGPIYKTVSMKIDTSIDVSSLYLGTGGEDQNWTFNETVDEWDVDFTTGETAGSPFEAAFPGAEWVQIIWQYIPEFMGIGPDVDSIFVYRRIADGFMEELGMGTHNTLMQGSPFVYPEASTVYPNPLRWDSQEWVERRQMQPTFLNLVAGTIHDSTVVTVEGWGTLEIPPGTYDCLLLKRHEFRHIQVPPIPLFLPNGYDDILETWTYTWVTHGYDLALSVTADASAGESFTQALYVIIANSPVGVGCDPECTTSNSLPTTFALRQNYPNPFNPATTIRYALPTPSQVELNVFSILGQNLATLETGVRPAGEHPVVWEGRDRQGRPVPAGIYFYRLTATPLDGSRTIVQTRKMIVTK